MNILHNVGLFFFFGGGGGVGWGVPCFFVFEYDRRPYGRFTVFAEIYKLVLLY